MNDEKHLIILSLDDQVHGNYCWIKMLECRKVSQRYQIISIEIGLSRITAKAVTPKRFIPKTKLRKRNYQSMSTTAASVNNDVYSIVK